MNQLAEIDAELIAMESRAETAEAAVAVATERLAAAETEAERAGNDVARARKRLDTVSRERDTLRAKLASLEEVGEQEHDRATTAEARAAIAEADLHAAATTRDELAAELSRRDALLERRDAELGEAVDRLDVANTAVADLQVALATARSDIKESTLRSGAAEQRLGDVANERDALLLEVAGLEQAAEERERRAAADLTRVALSSSETQNAELEEALAAARSDADSLRTETTTLSAQLEEAWKQVAAARLLAEEARAARVAEPRHEPAVSTDDEPLLLDALSELAAPDHHEDEDERRRNEDRREEDEPGPPEVSVDPPTAEHLNPNRGDPDARRAALGYLNSLANDVPASRKFGH